MLNEEKNILFLKECFDVTFYFIFKCVTPFIQLEVYNKTDRSIKTDYSDSICSLLYIVYRCSLINGIVKQHNKENRESDEE